MNDEIKKYIQEHKVLKSNTLIFRDWEEFLHELYLNNGRIEMIIWYEYCRINEQQIGMGGYKDTVNHGYMWAETHFYKTDIQDKSLNEVIEYINQMRDKYSRYNLYPEFYLC